MTCPGSHSWKVAEPDGARAWQAKRTGPRSEFYPLLLCDLGQATSPWGLLTTPPDESHITYCPLGLLSARLWARHVPHLFSSNAPPGLGGGWH